MWTLIVYVVLGYVAVYSIVQGFEQNLLIVNSFNETKTNTSKSNDKYQISSNKAKDCVITANDIDLFSLQRLVRSETVHIVELNLNFASNTSNSVIKEWRWRITNDVGKEILSVLGIDDICVTWTLTVGRETRHVNVTDYPSGCIASEKEPGVLIAKAIMKKLSPEKEMCFQEISNTSPQQRCCKAIGKDPVKFECRASFVGSEFVNILKLMLSMINIVLLSAWVPIVVYMGIFLQSKNTSETQGYLKLKDSPISLSSILSMLFWDGYGTIKSFLRRCLLIGLLFIFFWQIELLELKLNRFHVFFWIWAVLFLFSNLFAKSFDESDNHCSFLLSFGCQKILSLLHYNIDDVVLLAKTNVLGAVCLITLPFNIKRWKEMILSFCPECVSSQGQDDEIPKRSKLQKVWAGARCSVSLVLVFIMQVIFILLFTVDCYSSIVLGLARTVFERRKHISSIIWGILCEFACLFLTVYFVGYALEYSPCIAISLLCGLFLNFVNFFPYIVLISILVFYSWMYWKHVEEQYVLLMTLIFDENIEHKNGNKTNDNNSNQNVNDNNDNVNNDNNVNDNNDNVNNDNNVNDNNNNDDGAVPKCGTCKNDSELDIDDETVFVVSEELYEGIRERLLPYHGNLFHFFWNILGISVFAVISFTLVRVLQASNVSSTIQLFTTFSVGAFPYVMNVVAAKRGEKQSDAWEKHLKHSVEPLVKRLAKKPYHRVTQFIIPHQLVRANVVKARETLV